MDAQHFDTLTRTLSEAGSRRGLLGLLATLPLLGGLFALIGDGDETEAKGRRKRRKKKHKHGRPRTHGKHKKKKCKPNSLTKTCTGKCGSVRNNCKKTVDCGSCACDPPCEVCFTCQENPGATGTCVQHAVGTPCGDPGQVCQADGTCACAADSCRNPTPICANQVCEACTTSDQCPVDTICDDGACQTCDVVCQGPPAECGSALQTALLDGGTIYVCPGTYRGGFSILKNTIVIGAGQGDDPTVDTILDGGQQDRVVITNTVPVTLQGLRVTGGKVTDDDGGGILNLGQLTMTDCTVTANHAVAGQIGFGTGGGIRNVPLANLTMTNCTISQNSAALRAGGIQLLQGTHTLTNCTFTGNTAGGQGGAIFCNNGGATTLIGCTIGPGNDAPAGAIVVQNNSTLTLDATGVTGNTGTSIGGIGSSSGVVTLQNGSTVSGNSPNNCVGPITGPGCAP